MAKLPRDTITHYEHDGKGSMGKTYMIGDVLYHSGFPFKNDWQN